MTETDTRIRCRYLSLQGADSLLLSATATAVNAANARSLLTEWAHRHDVPSELIADVVYAAYEAIANVVEHAYSGGAGSFTLRADDTPHQLCVTISDTGSWTPPSPTPGWRGRGIPLIRALADSVHIGSDDAGTTVELYWQK
ncbi:ATP-binding protein [Antrihabitans stalactiti]|uniref:ATP-binding protein n=1 Tax=Antrihabitans stalactiti TaxID=2584121 RepID=A0A848KB83_9NOCA|nr:ATP-binding protein [Antrihabitans stalactiti]NMN93962.1 ATP-binding protein [Antrihabitans stalactiti]